MRSETVQPARQPRRCTTLDAMHYVPGRGANVAGKRNASARASAAACVHQVAGTIGNTETKPSSALAIRATTRVSAMTASRFAKRARLSAGDGGMSATASVIDW